MNISKSSLLNVHNAIFMLNSFVVHYTEPSHYKTNKMACVPSEDSDQPGHPPSLIKVFAVRSKGS